MSAADILDQASDMQEKAVSQAIQAIRNSANHRELYPKGVCHWCDEPFSDEPERLFCDEDCSGDYQKHKRMTQR
jgi:hypothetical protein